ncbi:MAG: 2Fe-2S iron-sulfur cluster-binding protein [Chloroflexota bacterium]
MHKITFVDHNKKQTELSVETGSNLRTLLLKNNLGPYTRFTRVANCGGRGICATCGVWIAENDEIPPDHWHDWAAKRFGYPRLSCQITVDRDLFVYQVDKWIWGNGRSKEKDMSKNI